MSFTATSQIVASAEYHSTADAFFAKFGAAWDACRCQILKLETRQTYLEPDSTSLQLFLAGDESRSLSLLAAERSDDHPIYQTVRKRRLDFIRCRPIEFPLSPYLKWELNVYKHNAADGERIFWCNRLASEELFSRFAQHDFMVFDRRCAFVHDYNAEGLIQGGWSVTDSSEIDALIALYGVVKANCQAFELLESSLYEPS